MSKAFASLALLLLLPLLVAERAHAAVKINEIAWMGTDANSSCEWVEFMNDGGEAVSLSGWAFTIANTGASTPKTITLGGQVGPGEYFVLARNSSGCESAVGTVAGYTFTSFGNGISNTASVLTLSDGHGYSDEVDASGGWDEVGGENKTGTTRKTAQRAGSVWVTALPTPMAENASRSDSDTPTTTPEVPPTTGSSTPMATIGGSAPSEGPLELSPMRVLHLDAGVNRIVHAYAPTPFRAVAYNEKGKMRSDAKIRWSFGDGVRKEGRDVWHTYRSPGTYLVAVRASEEEADTLRTLTVRVEEPRFSLSVEGKGISIRNGSGRIAELSGWQIRAGEESFTLPEDTAILPNAAVVFMPEVTGLAASSSAELLYPDGEVAFRYEAKAPMAQPSARPLGIQKVQKKVDLPATVSAISHEEVIDAPAAPTSEVAAGAVRGHRSPNWLLCLLASPLACGAALSVP